jgi:hypothetical protein
VVERVAVPVLDQLIFACSENMRVVHESDVRHCVRVRKDRLVAVSKVQSQSFMFLSADAETRSVESRGDIKLGYGQLVPIQGGKKFQGVLEENLLTRRQVLLSISTHDTTLTKTFMVQSKRATARKRASGLYLTQRTSSDISKVLSSSQPTPVTWQNASNKLEPNNPHLSGALIWSSCHPGSMKSPKALLHGQRRLV